MNRILCRKKNLFLLHLFIPGKDLIQFVNFFKLSIYLTSRCSHYYQMLTFTVKGLKTTSPSSTRLSLCPKIGCCWGVRGSHPCMFPTCSRTHPILPCIVATHSQHTPADTQLKCPQTKNTKHKGDVVTDAPVTCLAYLHLQNRETAGVRLPPSLPGNNQCYF